MDIPGVCLPRPGRALGFSVAKTATTHESRSIYSGGQLGRYRWYRTLRSDLREPWQPDTELRAYVSAVRLQVRAGDADRCVRFLPRVSGLRQADSTETRRLLRILLVWKHQVSAGPTGT